MSLIITGLVRKSGCSIIRLIPTSCPPSRISLDPARTPKPFGGNPLIKQI